MFDICIYVWPNYEYCDCEDLEENLHFRSDDYVRAEVSELDIIDGEIPMEVLIEIIDGGRR